VPFSGLPELPANPERFGRQVDNPGEPISGGLSPKSAQDFGLLAGTAVAVGIIDVHAGTIGCLATKTPDDKVCH
jgi:D-ribulokinase